MSSDTAGTKPQPLSAVSSSSPEAKLTDSSGNDKNSALRAQIRREIEAEIAADRAKEIQDIHAQYEAYDSDQKEQILKYKQEYSDNIQRIRDLQASERAEAQQVRSYRKDLESYQKAGRGVQTLVRDIIGRDLHRRQLYSKSVNTLRDQLASLLNEIHQRDLKHYENKPTSSQAQDSTSTPST